MADPEQKMVQLMEVLLEQTSQGQLTWVQDPDEDQQGMKFQVDVGDQLVTIGSRDNDGNHPYELTLWKRNPNPEGEHEWLDVEEISSGNFRGQVAASIAELWRHARGEALHINDSIDSALSILKDAGKDAQP
jgi:hypothetical protein